MRKPYFYMQEIDGEGSDLEGGASAEEATPEAASSEDSEAEKTPEVTDAQTAEAEAVKPFYSELPEDWRKQLALSNGATEDSDEYAKQLKQLERVPSMDVLIKNYFKAQETIRSGQVSSGLPDDATEEQIAEWREANGVPSTAADYNLSLEEGLVLGESDERIMGNVYDVAHKNNIPAGAVSELANAMLAGRQAEEEARIAQHGIDQQTSNRMLKEHWGQDYQANINMVSGLVGQMPENVKDAFASAVMPDGKAVFNSPEVVIAMSEWARAINPAAAVVPSSSNPMGDIKSELKALEARMGTEEWFKDNDAQKRYQELVTAQSSMN